MCNDNLQNFVNFKQLDTTSLLVYISVTRNGFEFFQFFNVSCGLDLICWPHTNLTSQEEFTGKTLRLANKVYCPEKDIHNTIPEDPFWNSN